MCQRLVTCPNKTFRQTTSTREQINKTKNEDSEQNLGSKEQDPKKVLSPEHGLCALNRNGTVWDDIVEDGKVGPATRKALQEAIKKDSKYLFGILNILQGAFYVNLKNEKYIRGWISRAKWTY